MANENNNNNNTVLKSFPDMVESTGLTYDTLYNAYKRNHFDAQRIDNRLYIEVNDKFFNYISERDSDATSTSNNSTDHTITDDTVDTVESICK